MAQSIMTLKIGENSCEGGETPKVTGRENYRGKARKDSLSRGRRKLSKLGKSWGEEVVGEP